MLLDAPVDTAPHLLDRPPLTVVVTRTVGDPAQVAGPAIGALFAAACGRALGHPRSRWSNIGASRDEWVGVWALPLAEGAAVVPVGGPIAVTVERWTYGIVAEILHVGPWASEGESVARLARYAAEQGYELTGEHEEEYLTMPDAPEQRTIIRYAVRRRG